MASICLGLNVLTIWEGIAELMKYVHSLFSSLFVLII